MLWLSQLPICLLLNVKKRMMITHLLLTGSLSREKSYQEGKYLCCSSDHTKEAHISDTQFIHSTPFQTDGEMAAKRTTLNTSQTESINSPKQITAASKNNTPFRCPSSLLLTDQISQT